MDQIVFILLLRNPLSSDLITIFTKHVFDGELNDFSNAAIKAFAKLCGLSTEQLIVKQLEITKRTKSDNSPDQSMDEASKWKSTFSKNAVIVLFDLSLRFTNPWQYNANSKSNLNSKYDPNPTPKKKRKRNPLRCQTRNNYLVMAWLHYLGSKSMDIETYYKVLSRLEDEIFPVFKKSNVSTSKRLSGDNLILLCDFLTDSYNIGGEISLLSLKGLFILMTKHNLEYPLFYEKLYGKLQYNLLFSKHSTKFFELLRHFLLNTQHLPLYLVVAFMKRLSRMALFAPPQAIIFCVNLITELLKKYPAARFLVDRSKRGAEGVMEAMQLHEQQKMKRNEAKTTDSDSNSDDDSDADSDAKSDEKSETKSDGETNRDADGGNESKDQIDVFMDTDSQNEQNDKNGNVDVGNNTDSENEDGIDLMGDDPFDFECLDPKQCGAMKSSLWELKSLSNHFEYKTSGHCFQTVHHFMSNNVQRIKKEMLPNFAYKKLLNYYFSRDRYQTQKEEIAEAKSRNYAKQRRKYDPYDISVDRKDHLFPPNSLFGNVFSM